jgi:hypothetical protein
MSVDYKDSTVLILASGRCDPGLRTFSGAQTTVSLPIGTNQVELWREWFSGKRIVVTFSPEEAARIEVLALKSPHIEFFEASSDLPISEVIKAVIDTKSLKGDLEIIYGDTFSDKSELPPDTIRVSLSPESARYQQVLSADGQILFPPFSGASKRQIVQNFIGHFRLSDCELFQRIPSAASNSGRHESQAMGLWRSLEEYSRTKPIRLMEDSSWVDIGNMAGLLQIKFKNQVGRAFNQFRVSDDKDWVRKTSEQEGAKLDSELRWFQDAALHIDRPPLPTVRPITGGYEVEVIPGLSLADLLVAGEDSDAFWESAVMKLLSDFLVPASSIHAPKEFDESAWVQKVLVEKVTSRFEKLDRSLIEELEVVESVNGVAVENLNSVMSSYRDGIHSLDPSRFSRASLIHGDLCFSNIVRKSTSEIFVIDPRGADRQFGSYGLIEYDLAKLRHSVRGNYELLNRELFHLSIGKNANLLFAASASHKKTTAFLNDKISEIEVRLGLDADFVRLVEVGLFLSMAPLHSESRTRQMAILLQALSLWSSRN